MQPTDIAVLGVPPFVGTFDHSECEVAAALMVYAAQDKGNWEAVTQTDVHNAIEKRKDVVEWFDNPFCRPDFHRLVKDGYARFLGDTKSPIEFTDAGLERLKKWERHDG